MIQPGMDSQEDENKAPGDTPAIPAAMGGDQGGDQGGAGESQKIDFGDKLRSAAQKLLSSAPGTTTMSDTQKVISKITQGFGALSQPTANPMPPPMIQPSPQTLNDFHNFLQSFKMGG